jgi:hypothetical protein
MYYALVRLQKLCLSLSPFTTVFHVPKKKFADDAANFVLRTASAETFLLGFRAEYSVNTQTEPKTKTCFGLPKPSPIPNLKKQFVENPWDQAIIFFPQLEQKNQRTQ